MNLKQNFDFHRLGRMLHIDVEKGEVLNDPEAGKLITSKYRNPYLLPERI